MNRSQLCLALVAVVCLAGFAHAQGFAGPRVDMQGGLTGWIIAKQSEFYRALSAALKSGHGMGLIGLSFLYGAFHAAGPGHGKAVISSYIVANDETYTRGLVLCALSSLIQALSALVIVGLFTLLLNATARTMSSGVRVLELAAFATMTAMGLWLIFKKGRASLALLRAWRRGEAITMSCDANCSHGPDPAQIRLASWRETAALVLATGLRPCSGALIVLVFALSQQAVALGVASVFAMAFGTMLTIFALASIAKFMKQLAVRLAANRPGFGLVAMSLIEVMAAILITLFGFFLLTGTMVSEKTMPF